MIENTDIHDVRITAEGQHLECVMSHSPGVTFRGDTFRNCGVFDISLGRGDWWGQPQYGNVTIENNVFGHTVDGGAAGDWHYFGLAWWLTTLDGARVVNNTFENDGEHGPLDESAPAACGRTTSAAAGSASRA